MADKKILELSAKAAPVDTDAIVVQEAGGAAGSTKYALLSSLWTWAKAKADLLYAAIGHTHAGVYDPVGTASSAVADHVAALDPHTQYLTATEGNAAYDPVGTAAGERADHESDYTHTDIALNTGARHTHANLTALDAVSGANTGDEAIFAGAGADGLVPDPVIESGKYLRDDGTWQTVTGGDATQAFGTISVAGQSDVVAEAAPDTLVMAAGANIQIVTDAATDTVTIAAAHDHSGVYQPSSATLTTLSSATAAGLALMDDADASAQRATLGLGGSATLNVGTTTGTVAAGDDSRITGAIPAPATPAAGDLLVYSGTAWARLPHTVAFTPAAAAVTVDFSQTVKTATVTLVDASTAVTLSGGRAGAVYVLILQQDGAGNRAVTFGAELDFSADITASPTLSTGASKRDLLGVLCITPGSAYFLIGYNRGF